MPTALASPTALIAIADQFVHRGQITDLTAFGNGNINDTFLVSLDDGQQTRFVLQRINTQVFRHPEWVMGNMSLYCAHVGERLKRHPLDRRWEVPTVIVTRTGQDHWQDDQGNFWRAISFIEGSECFDTLHDTDHAHEIGYALGMFHTLVSDLPPDKLADTLVGYHITPQYVQQYQQVLAQRNTQPATSTGAANVSAELQYCLDFVAARQKWATILEDAKATGKLPLRLMHGDPKVNNVMFDCATGKAVSVIDLDTVKPGLVHYDLGDCLRSGCNPAGEETQDWQAVQFDLDLCQAMLQGYNSVAKAFLTANDYAYVLDGIRLIAFELGLRFFTDYLAGSVYFKTKYPDHNLCRALVQFQLTASIEAQAQQIQALVQDLQ